MSELGEKLANYITDSGLNISKVSRLTGIERTKIIRQRNGKGHVTEEELKQIMSLLQLSREEENEMMELYKMELVGRDIYDTRKMVQEVAEKIGKTRRNWNRMQEIDISSFSVPFPVPQGIEPGLKTDLITEDMLIADIIQYAIYKEVNEHEAADIRMDHFRGCETVMEHLIRLERKDMHRINCVQYVGFMKSSNSGAGVYNLDIIKNIIPFVFTWHNSYQVKYTYVSSANEDSERMLPHFILTHDIVLLLSEKADRMLFIEDERIADAFRKECMENEKNYRNLFKKVDKGIESLIAYYSDNIFVHGPEFILESNPCFAFMFYPELIEIEKDNLYLQQLYQYVLRVFDQEKAQCVDYFGWTKEMDDFLQTGSLPGVYGQYSRKYTPEERKKMLEHFIMFFEVQGDNKKACLLKNFDMEEGINIELYPDNKLSFHSVSDKYPLCIATLEESGLCKIFRDYFESLKDSEQVYTWEETKEFLGKKIAEIGG